MPALAATAVVLVAAALLGLIRRERARAAELDALAGQVRELSTRLESAEQDLARVQTQADVAESLLVEKGVADEEDVAEVRRRFDAGDDSRPRDGDLH
jgi:outer membrane murein-binding lipoprotein Lpp